MLSLSFLLNTLLCLLLFIRYLSEISVIIRSTELNFITKFVVRCLLFTYVVCCKNLLLCMPLPFPPFLLGRIVMTE